MAMKTPAVVILLTSLLPVLASTPVRIRETQLVLPTYLAAPPSPVPRFYDGRTYQGAKATFYPYPVQDVLTDTKTNMSYKALFLENDFIEISVIPELGGRIWSARDKVNGYDFFYRQHVVKPALIGMLGAWISGGVEWNVPHHHRATSFSAVDYAATTNADGSATIWVGEIELRHRMKWLVGMTLYPDRSGLELTCKAFNRTPFAWPMLFWINAAVHANTSYQVIFPPSTEWAAQHSKPEFASWPMARQVYGGTDYTRGVDISWWKNHPNPVSFFAWNYEDDWFGGYDHGRQAGVVHVADHRIAPGKKFFEWGNGPEGDMWTKILSDEDGPYLELMAGAWSDNQPDYSWIQPGETREWKHWWYPIRNMGGVKAANHDVALNLEVTNRSVRIAVNTTREFRELKVRLEAIEGPAPSGGLRAPAPPVGDRGKTLFERVADLGPAKPFAATILVETDVPPENLRLLLTSSDGRELLTFQPARPRGTPMPKPVEKPKSPKDYATADELYFTGQRIEQLYSPSFEARPYYEEILRRDPGDYRANTALGILLCKQWRWGEAAKYLSNALARATANHIRPKDGEAWYYLGVALKAQDRDETARQAFSQAVWSQAWRAAGHYGLAEIYARLGDHRQAIKHLEESLQAHHRNPTAMALKAALHYQLKEDSLAAQLLDQVRANDPLDLRPAALRWLKSKMDREAARVAGPELAALQTTNVNTWLEVAGDFANAGLYSDAFAISTCYGSYYRPGTRDHEVPLRFYAAAYYLDKAGTARPADQELLTASRLSPEFCFPWRFEDEALLRWAIAKHPQDARAPFYLGNLLYDHQPDNAIRAWEEARKRDDAFALTHRNLAIAYAQHEKNIPKAIASLEKAVALNPREARFLYELDVLYESGGAPVTRRLEMLTKHHDTVTRRDDALTREIVLLTVAGQADRALELLRGRHFRNWEGSSQIHNVYVDACLARGQQLAAQKRPREALAAFEAALDYPENLEVGRARRSPRTAQIQYLIGTAHESVGDASAAKAAFEKAAAGRDRGATESGYFQALALQKLGRSGEARPVFERLVRAGEEQLTKGEAPDYFAKFGEKTSERVRQANAHYLIGLGGLGLGEKTRASQELRRALDLHPAHLGASLAIAGL